MNLLPKIMLKKGSRRTGGLERRLHRRALLYWHSIGRGRDFPSVADFDPLALEDRSAHGFMVDVTNSARPMLTHVGLVLRDEASVKSVPRSEEHTSELQSLMRISYAVFCLKKKKQTKQKKDKHYTEY